MSRVAALTVAVLLAGAVSTPAAEANDYAAVARNIIPSGQYGSVPIPAGADEQARMYDSLTPLFDQVTAPDLMTAFKSEGFGVGPDGPARPEPMPRAGVTVVRDRFNVPHITGRSRDDVTWAMGWLLQQDRGLLLAQARDAARLAAIDAPNVYAFGLVINLRQYTPTPEVDRMIERNGLRALREAGAPGRALLHDIDVYLQGINARLKAERSTARPWTRVDVFAANAIIGEIFGEGGGDEALPLAVPLVAAQAVRPRARRPHVRRLLRVRRRRRAEHDDATFRYGTARGAGRGNAVLDAGSWKPTGPQGLARASAVPDWASNFLLVGAKRSATGHPLFVGGPQIGYTYPGLTLEADISWPGGQARGATAPGLRGQHPDRPRPGLRVVADLRGLGPRRHLRRDAVRRLDARSTATRAAAARWAASTRAWSRTSAGSCYRTTVHGPVTGYAKVGGRTVAVSRKRASFGQDVLWQLGFRDLTVGKVRSAETFRKALASSPFTFNVGYADDRDIAMYSAGRLPIRPASVDPRLPIKGTGEYEWRGILAPSKRPYQANPPTGVLVNWNNRPAPGWGAADDNWSYGSAQRVEMLNDGLAKRERARPRVGDQRDERGGHAGPAQRRADADPRPAAARAPGRGDAAGHAHARMARGLAGSGLVAAGRRARRRDRRRPRARDLGRVLPEAVGGGDAGRRAPGVRRQRLRHRQRLHRRRLLVPREGPRAPRRDPVPRPVQRALLR